MINKQKKYLCILLLIEFTYTTCVNSKSPNIKCFGRVSTILFTDIRRVRVVLTPVDTDASLLAKDVVPCRSAKKRNANI